MPNTNHRLKSWFLFFLKSQKSAYFIPHGVPNPNGGLITAYAHSPTYATTFVDQMKELWESMVEQAQTTASINTAWNNPQYIDAAWQNGKSIDPVTLLPDMDFWLLPKHKPANTTDKNSEAVIVIYSARTIVEHGGLFCATQIRARNQNKGTQYNDSWTVYQLPDGDPDKTCYWLCEPGYSGDACLTQGRATSADSCAYMNLSADNLAQYVSYNETGSRDASSVEQSMENNFGFFSKQHKCKSDRCEGDVILAAKSYLPNGHGIIASPATVVAHSVYGAWDENDYTYMKNQKFYYKNAQVNLQITDNGGDYTTKTLCMPGFDGPGCTTTLCTECADPLTKFNSQTGTCSDCIEEHIHDDTGACVPCPDGSYKHPSRDECITCDNTEYYSNGTCIKKTSISRDTMYSCFPNTDFLDFQACIFDTCQNDKTVDCVMSDGRIGKKTCVANKWTSCNMNQTTGTQKVQATIKPVITTTNKITPANRLKLLSD